MSVVCTLYSGSSGNCTYAGSLEEGILIDMGGSLKKTVSALEGIGVPFGAVRAVFITHEHSDHISGLKMLQKKLPSVSVFANEKTLSALLKSKAVEETDSVFVCDGTTETAGLEITPFDTMHDSIDSCGYLITQNGKKVAGVTTDLGCISQPVRDNLYGCPAVVLESNYDKAMLASGSYPYYLKQRIMAEDGHLSNDDCAAFLPTLLFGGTKSIILAHISKNNNLPSLAESCAVNSLDAHGVDRRDYTLEAAPRNTPSKPIFVQVK